MLKKFIAMPVLALALILPITSCANNVEAGESQPPPGGMPAYNRPSLADTQWVLDSYGNPVALTIVISGTRITLKWNSKVDVISGNAGCNSYGGKAHIHDGMLNVSDLYNTAMACLTPGVMEQEAKYLDLLGKAATWDMENGKLVITTGNGEVLIYSKDENVPAPLTNLANTKWKLTTIVSGEVASSVLAGTTVTLNFNETATSAGGMGGVNVYGGDCRIIGSLISISNIFSTKMFKDDPPGLQAQENKYFELLGKAVSFKANTAQMTICCQDGVSLIFSAA
jgi:heat shock protein HslJ